VASEEKSEKNDAKPKKGGKLKTIIISVLAIALLGGGGAAGGFYFAGTMQQDGPAKPDLPKLVLKDGTEVDSNEKAIKTLSKGELQLTYHELENAFTTNLQGGGFAQAEIAVSTPYDTRVIEAVETHDIAVRSAIVMALAAGDSATLETQPGKEAMAVKLRDVINETLREKVGFGGIDEVYFTKFVVQ
jgi:flagellar FliL protein